MKKYITKSIALFGGAFDPPHNGHMSVLNKLDSIEFINEIWVLPSGNRSDKSLLLSNE
jgi:nicotinate-nucleotide adenylyltransferase